MIVTDEISYKHLEPDDDLSLIAKVRDAIFDTLCPGIRFTTEDDARYTAAAKAVIAVLPLKQLYEVLEDIKELADHGEAQLVWERANEALTTRGVG